jgi:hypothetical protein
MCVWVCVCVRAHVHEAGVCAALLVYFLSRGICKGSGIPKKNERWKKKENGFESEKEGKKKEKQTPRTCHPGSRIRRRRRMR